MVVKGRDEEDAEQTCIQCVWRYVYEEGLQITLNYMFVQCYWKIEHHGGGKIYIYIKLFHHRLSQPQIF